MDGRACILGMYVDITDRIRAEEQIPELAPALVVVDISLPGMSGLELVATLRAKHPDLHLVVVTGHDESRYAAASFRAGADGFVRKGDTEAILRLLRQTLAPA